jgi:hypothetical protein
LPLLGLADGDKAGKLLGSRPGPAADKALNRTKEIFAKYLIPQS